MNKLYADGGVIGKNPSEIGGTWAYRILEPGRVVFQQSGVITPREAEVTAITNNLTEMLALVRGLAVLPPNWIGTVYSDSQVTLGRAFLGWKWNNVPLWLFDAFKSVQFRLVDWDLIKYVLLDGHPTKAELKAGVGKRGHPVSKHNVWCDEACRNAAKKFMVGVQR